MATNKVVRANSLKDLPFEFLLTVNGNIVCQRFFTIDDFIPKSVSSIGSQHNGHIVSSSS